MSAHVTTSYRFAPIPEDLLYDDRLNGNDVRVYGVLMRHGLDPESCYPSITRLAELCAMSDRTVRRSLTTLAEAGWVTVHPLVKDDGTQTSNAYRLHTGGGLQICQGDPDKNDRGTLTKSADERESFNESHRKKTLTAPETLELIPSSAPPGESEKVDLEAEFEDWYSGYPRKVGKGAARKAYKAARAKQTASVLLDARTAFAALIRSQGTRKDYIPHPATWLNQERWEDDMDDEGNDGLAFKGPEMRFG